MAETTRLSLIERARVSPQDDAWQKLIEIYDPFIGGYLRRRGLKDSDIDDIRQEVLQVLTRELPKFEHNQRTGAFRAWLRKVMANRLLTYWKSPAQRQQVGGSEYNRLAEGLSDPDSELSQAWNREHNHHVIQCLMKAVSRQFNEKTMAAFRKTFLEEQPIDQVAGQLGLSVNAVALARGRVMRALREVGAGMID